jgi:DNA-binding NarL/FixJ family response regulator
MVDHRDLVRFEAKVSKDAAGCWLWRAGTKGGGYGAFWLHGALRGAHRASLYLYKGAPLDTPLDAMHSCDTPGCVNPDHLSYGTRTQNMRDASQKGRTVRVADWRGVRNPRAKLSDDQRVEVERLIELGTAKKLIAQQFGLSAVRIQQIAREVQSKKAIEVFS